MTVHEGAVTSARRLKLQIPLAGWNGVPIEDQMEFDLRFTNCSRRGHLMEGHIELVSGATPAVGRACGDPDHLLLRRVNGGDPAAFEALVQKYKQPIIGFANRALGDPDEAQDVAQNAFVRAFKEAGRFRFASRFSTWLYAITRNLCRNELRRRQRQLVHLSNYDDSQYVAPARWQVEGLRQRNASEALLQNELQEKIEQALAGLPGDQRTALLLLQDTGLCYADIASVLGTTLAATKSLIHRARQTLKHKLRPYLRNGAWAGVRSGASPAAPRCPPQPLLPQPRPSR